MTTEPPTQVFTDKDNGKQFFIRNLHDPFLVKLSGNQTTGYSWEVAERLITSKTDDKNVVEVKGLRITRSYEAGKGIGGQGQFTFRCQPTGTGLQSAEFYTLEFVYRRPWETKNDAENIVYKLTLRA